MVATVSSRNCNDWGVCGGPSVTIDARRHEVRRRTADREQAADRSRCSRTAASCAIGKRIPVAWRVKDDSGRARWFAALYSGGTQVGRCAEPGPGRGVRAGGERAVAAVRRRRRARSTPASTPRTRPASSSADAPMSSCRWATVQVPVPSVSNGCGAAPGASIVADTLNWIGDMRTYGSTPVNIRPACNQHDAGYAGVAVAGINTPRVTDYRTWSREQVDQKFYDDIMIQCRRFLAGRRTPPTSSSAARTPTPTWDSSGSSGRRRSTPT